MRDNARGAMLILFVLAIVLVVLFNQSIDKHKDEYKLWNIWLGDLKVSSLKLDEAMLFVRTGIDTNYDQLSDSVLEIERYLLKLENEESSSGNRSRVQHTTRSLRPETKVLEAVIRRHRESIEQFKSSLSILRNSHAIAQQLFDEMRALDTADVSWQQVVNGLEYRMLKEFQIESLIAESTVHAEISQLAEEASSSAKQSYLKFLAQHVYKVERYAPLVSSAMKEYLNDSSQLREEINHLKQGMTIKYEKAYEERTLYFYALMMAVCCVLVYGGWQATRAIRYSRQIRDHNASLEHLIEQRTSELKTREAFFRAITETATDPIVLIDEHCSITFVNSATSTLFGFSELELLGQSMTKILPGCTNAEQMLTDCANEWEGRISGGESIDLKISTNEILLVNGQKHFACIMHDLTEIKAMQRELSHASKLESVGQLAAGIAHEINTPAQFISDNLIFLQESVTEIFDLLKALDALQQDSEAGLHSEEVKQLMADADLEYLSDEIPSALKQSSEGIDRVATIVRAMKDYSHPGGSMELSDINAGLQSTIIVSKSEWKYFAEMKVEFEDDLPLVPCIISDVNQVVLNIIVNAAHAIVDKHEDADEVTGLITLSTRSDAENVYIEIADNGKGMPDAVKDRIFDPFFTTKGVGKGTGQGLSIAYALIAEKHNGNIVVDSIEGEGTTFTISLPVEKQPLESKVA